jgi:ABC-2 type transport system ATP-binding protein
MRILIINELSKSYYKKKVFEDLNLIACPGELIAVIGENGRGKTTVFKLLLSLLKADHGSIKYCGEEINLLSRNLFGYLPEDRCLMRDLSVYQQINFFIRLRKFDSVIKEHDVDMWLKKLDAFQYKHQLIKVLSKGNQQKVQLICAVIHQPKIVILDEPYTGLDQHNAKLFTSIIEELKANGTIIFLSSHQWFNCEDQINQVLTIKDNYSCLVERLIIGSQQSAIEGVNECLN